jgi:hypothetical protein
MISGWNNNYNPLAGFPENPARPGRTAYSISILSFQLFEKPVHDSCFF